MYIHLRGPIGRLVILVLAIGGFILALGDVLDFYDAWWKFTVPLTLVYAVVIWRFALATPKGEPEPAPGWPLGLNVIIVKLATTVGLLLATLGVIALGYDLFLLVAHNWHIIVVALGLVVVIMLVALIPGLGSSRKRRRAANHPDRTSASAEDVNL